MIKPNELRIGNLVSCRNQIIAIESVVANVINISFPSDNDIEGILIKDIEPIPLTPEWLERCGFNWEDSCLKIDLNNARMKLGFQGGARDKMTLFQTSCPGDGSIITTMHFGWNHPEYVHQLQNLIYALTGEELTIKEPA